MDARMLYLHTLSRLHAGTGQSTDVIDLPVAREKVYGWPYVPASSIKGVLRDACDPKQDRDKHDQQKLFEKAFGPPTEHAEDQAGRLWFTDGHLLFLPVRSFAGTFAWVTCHLALLRWQRDHDRCELKLPAGVSLPAAPKEGQIKVAIGSALVLDKRVYLEDYDFAATEDSTLSGLSGYIAGILFGGDENRDWRTAFMSRVAVVTDDAFTALVETGTEVDARIRLSDETKTVTRGALWYEEAVPAEAVFSGPLLIDPNKKFSNGTKPDQLFEFVSTASQSLLQLGGNASVGRGLVEARLVGGGQ